MSKELLISALFCLSCFVNNCVSQEIDLASDEIQTMLYVIANKTEDGRFVRETRMRIHLPGEKWEGRPGKGLDFVVSTDDIDEADAMTGRFDSYQNLLSDVELVDYQKEELKQIQAEMKKKATALAKEVFAKSSKLTDEQKQRFVEKFAKLKTETEAKTQAVLLPDQVQWLAQGKARRKWDFSVSAFLANKEVREKLDLTKEQIKEVKEAEAETKRELEELAKKLAEEKAKIQAKGKKSVHNVLTRKQQEILAEMVGDRKD